MTDGGAPSSLFPPAQQTLDFPAGKCSTHLVLLSLVTVGWAVMPCGSKRAFKADLEQLVGITAGLFLVRSEVSAFP